MKSRNKRYRRVSVHDTLQWVQNLYTLGIRVFYHADLPTRYQSIRYCRKASWCGYIEPTGNKKGVVKEWEIRNDIMFKTPYCR